MSAPLPFTSRQCPMIRVDCPDVPLVPGIPPVKFSVHVEGANPQAVPTYEWSVWHGKIVGGQGTTEILVDITGFDYQGIGATAKVGGLDPLCENLASCTIIACPPPLARKFDEYGSIAFKDEKARLDNFAIQLQNEPSAQGYIIAYDPRPVEAQARATRAKDLMVSYYGFDPGRIVTVNGGYRKNREVELWITPTGATPPTPTPEVPSDKAQTGKSALKRN